MPKPFLSGLMLYAKLIARISEASRTLVLRGKNGKFEQNSSVFCTGTDVREVYDAQEGWLKLCDGHAVGLYRIVRIVGSEIHVSDPFVAFGSGVSWELYNPGVSEEDTRKVLQIFPDILMECEEDEQVKTYLGVIKIVRRKRKRVKDPQGRWTYSPERLQARLRPGKRLQRSLDLSEDPLTSLEDPEEDPTL